MTIKQNPDIEYTNKVLERLRENNNYCPCQIERNDDTKCMCKKFRDMIDNQETGYCHCKLYYIEQDERN
ncbi:MAG: ferredoxin thioredoxin reductase catalytic beta chain [Clostridia bacterium]|nr:ferredoxin thioredoxin reductase catalytic beta chain [Clostridia bacterium]